MIIAGTKNASVKCVTLTCLLLQQMCQRRFQAISPFPPLSLREEKEREPGIEVADVLILRSIGKPTALLSSWLPLAP